MNPTPEMILIVAMDSAGAIGRGNQLPWRLPDDLRQFKALTRGHVVLMGRKTWDSIGRPLPDRENLVLSRQLDFSPPGATPVHSLEDALRHCGDRPRLFVIGGAEIYALTLPLADRLYLTRVEVAVTEADTWFPPWPEAEFQLVAEAHHPADARHAHAFTFQEYVRRPRHT